MFFNSMNKNDDNKNIAEQAKLDAKQESEFFTALFENAEKESDDQLYKKNLYVLKEDIEKNKDQNSLKFMHDVLINKLMMEDYTVFPPKNDNQLLTKQSDKGQKNNDDPEKLLEEENEFLRELHRINYLTFSPFGLSFFDKMYNDINEENRNKDKLKEGYINSPSDCNNNEYKNLSYSSGKNKKNVKSSEELKEEFLIKEEKLHGMINFNYNSYEINNDLLFNICQGFVDIDKLKECNLSINQSKPAPVTNTTENKYKKEEEEVKENRSDDEEEIDQSLIDDTLEIVQKEKATDFFNGVIDNFLSDLKKVEENSKNKEKNKFFEKWNKILNQRKKEYDKILYKEKLEEEKLRLEEEKRRAEEEKIRQIEETKKKEQNKEFEERRELIRKRAKERIKKKKTASMSAKKK